MDEEPEILDSFDSVKEVELSRNISAPPCLTQKFNIVRTTISNLKGTKAFLTPEVTMKRSLYSRLSRVCQSDDRVVIGSKASMLARHKEINNNLIESAEQKEQRITKVRKRNFNPFRLNQRATSFQNIQKEILRASSSEDEDDEKLENHRQLSQSLKLKTNLVRNHSVLQDFKGDFSSLLSSTDDSSEIEKKGFAFTTGSHMISKRRGKPSEDALFTTPNYLGIADGVGGWVEYGVDSSKFSNELMKNCKNEVIKFNQEIEQSANYESEESDYDLFGSNNSKCSQNYDANSLESGSVSHEATEIKPKNVLNPTTVLSKAYRKVRSIGSSTACV